MHFKHLIKLSSLEAPTQIPTSAVMFPIVYFAPTLAYWMFFLHPQAYKASGTRALNVFMKGLYAGDLFLTGNARVIVIDAGNHFLKASGRLAFLTFSNGEDRFPVTPKHHMMFHLCKLMQWQSDVHGYCMNVLVDACYQDEDFVGRLARLCRAVSPRATAIRTIQRYLLQTRAVWFKTDPD